MGDPTLPPSHGGAITADPESLGGLDQIVKTVTVTGAVLFVVLVWPVSAWSRFKEIRDSTLGFQFSVEDPLLLIGGLILFGLVLALLMTARPLRRYGPINELQAGFRDVVAQSYFGQGHRAGWTKTNPDAHLGDLEWPTDQEPSTAGDGAQESVQEQEIGRAHV